jgi:hypothetical protein
MDTNHRQDLYSCALLSPSIKTATTIAAQPKTRRRTKTHRRRKSL